MDGAVVGIRASGDITNGEFVGRDGRNDRRTRVWRGAVRGTATVFVAVKQKLMRRTIPASNA